MGGKKGGGSRSPRIDKNTLNSAQKLKVVDLISSGEIAGFINGNDNPLKSVYLNDTPVQNEDGSMNHAGVQFEFNNGAIDQDYLPSLSSIDNSVSVGVEVEKKNPITRTVTNQQVTSVRVTVGVDALMRSTKEGDQLATSVDMSIQIIKNGNIYASEHMHLNEKGNQPFRLDYVFSNLPTAPFDIRCVRVTDDSNDDMLRNKTYFFSYVESIDIKVRMPGSAVAMLQIDSQQFGSNNPARNYGINGCIIQVPSNYDPVARTYTGMWDRLFKPAFTNNPAWVLYDVLTADECLGEKFKDYRIDIDRLYELSKYSDSLVDDGNGGKEPRFVCNMVLFGDDASTVLDNICSIFRGTYSNANNHFTVQFDQKSDPVAIYNNSSVENGEFNYSYVPATELFNQIKVEYIDKFDGYRTKIDEVSDESNIAKYGLRSTSITAFGATKRSYALRCAKWNLVTALTENETVTFVLGAAGIRHEQHDIIKIADNDYAGAQIGGRIESVDGNTITVDRELSNVKEFIINVNGSTKTFKVIKAIDAKTYQLDDAVNAVDYVQFVATLNNLEPRLFRCIHIEEDSEINKYTVTAIKHNPQKEAIVDKGAEYIEGNPSVLNPLPHLSNGIVTTEGKAIVLRWDSLETTGSENTYIVKLYNGTNFVSRTETKDTFIRLENLPGGNYVARICAVNEQGQYSEELVIAFSTTYVINGVRFTPIVFGIRLNWEVPPILTTEAHTEIWYSKQNDVTEATKLANLPYPQNTYTLNGLSIGDEFYFWFRLVDVDGNQGEFTHALLAKPNQDSEDILGYLKGKITETELGDDVVNGIIKDVIADQDFLDEINNVVIGNLDIKLADIDTKISNEVSKDVDDKLSNLDVKISNEVSGQVNKELSGLDEKIEKIIQDSDIILKINNRIADSESELQVLALSQVSSSEALTAQTLVVNAKTDLNSAELQVVNMAQSSSDHAQAAIITAMMAQTDSSIATIKSEQSVFASDLEAKAQDISGLNAKVGSNEASILNQEKAFADEKISTSQRFNDVNAKVGENESSIKKLSESTSNELNAIAKDVINLDASVELSATEIQISNLSQASADSSLSSSISILNAVNDVNAANIKRVDEVLTSKTDAQAQSISEIKTSNDDNAASIKSLDKAFVDEKSATSQRFNETNAKVDKNTSSITSLSESTASEFEVISKDMLNIEAKTDENSAEIQIVNFAQSTADMALSSSISAISASTDANSANIKHVDEVLTSKTDAQAQSISELNVKSGANDANIKSVEKAFVDEKSSTTQRFNETNTKVGENETQIQVSTFGSSTSEMSLASSISALSASTDSSLASIKQVQQVTADEISAQAKSITRLETDVADNKSSINTLSQSTSDKFGAQAQEISQLNTKAGENEASITEAKNSIANVNGKVEATYSLTANANGQITGFKFGTDGKQSVFNIMADSFVISNTVNGQVVTPFIWSQNKLVLDGDMIATGSIKGDALIAGSSIQAPIIKGGRIESGHIAGGSINIGNGNFNVDSSGNLTANNGTFGGTIYADKIVGDVVNLIRLNTNEAYSLSYLIQPENYNRFVMLSDLMIRLRDEGPGTQLNQGVNGTLTILFNDSVFISQKTTSSSDGSIGNLNGYFYQEILHFNGSDRQVLWKFGGATYSLPKNTPLRIEIRFTPGLSAKQFLLRAESSALLLTRSSSVI